MQEEHEDYIPKQLAIILEVSENLETISEFYKQQYKQKAFKLVIELNNRIIDNDLVNAEELRNKLIPTIEEMFNNGWTLIETYEKSENLDKLKDVFTREYLLKLIDNLL